MKSNPFIKTAYRSLQQTVTVSTGEVQDLKDRTSSRPCEECQNDDLALSVQDLNQKTHCNNVENSALPEFPRAVRSSLGRQSRSLEEMRRSLYQSNVPLDFRMDQKKVKPCGSTSGEAIIANARQDDIDQDWLLWALETTPGSFR